VERIAETLGVTRSNQVERASSKRQKRGRQTRAGDAELTADIRRLVDTGRPMDTAGSPRSSSASGEPPVTIPSMPSVSTG